MAEDGADPPLTLNQRVAGSSPVKHRPRPASVAEPTISPDSLLEGTGFEPSVPRRISDAVETALFASAALSIPPERPPRFARGTGGSKLSSSASQSAPSVSSTAAGKKARLLGTRTAQRVGERTDHSLARTRARAALQLAQHRQVGVACRGNEVSHGRSVTFQMAGVAVSRQMFADILMLIARLRAPPAPA